MPVTLAESTVIATNRRLDETRRVAGDQPILAEGNGYRLVVSP
jgi:hypothetical protein